MGTARVRTCVSVGRPGSWWKPKKVMSEWMKETNLGKLQLSALPLIRCIQINGGRCKRATCLPSSISESVRERGHSLFALARLEARWRLRKLLRRLTGGFCATLPPLRRPPCRFQAREKPCCVFHRLRPQPSIPSFIPFIRHYRGREPYFGRKAKLEFDEEKSLQR